MSTSPDDPTGTTESPNPAAIQRQQMIADALRQKVPAAVLDPSSLAYDDLDSAAQAFYSAIGDYDHKAEQSGIIYSDGQNKYHYSIPIPQKDDGFKIAAQVTPEQKLAAIFHTHPGTDNDAMWFSPADVQVADKLKVPSYIHFEKDASLRKYVPGVTPVKREDFAGMMNSRVSRGELIKQALIAQALKQ